jgi:hypothetical protein
MKKDKFDGVLEAARLDANNQLLLARIYEKHGVVWSDHFLVKRDELIRRIQDGAVFVVGKRKYKLGSSFDIVGPLHISQKDGQAYIHLDQDESPADSLQKLPRF